MRVPTCRTKFRFLLAFRSAEGVNPRNFRRSFLAFAAGLKRFVLWAERRTYSFAVISMPLNEGTLYLASEEAAGLGWTIHGPHGLCSSSLRMNVVGEVNGFPRIGHPVRIFDLAVKQMFQVGVFRYLLIRNSVTRDKG